MRLRLLSGKRLKEKLRANAHPFVPQQTLNTIMMKTFFNPDPAYVNDPSLIFDNQNQTSLELSQNATNSSLLRHDLFYLQSSPDIRSVNLLCPVSLTKSDPIIDSKLITIDETLISISESRPNFKDLCDNGCVISPLHESSHSALAGTGMRVESFESPLKVDGRDSNVVWLRESGNMPHVNLGRQLLPELEGGFGTSSKSKPSSSREVSGIVIWNSDYAWFLLWTWHHVTTVPWYRGGRCHVSSIGRHRVIKDLSRFTKRPTYRVGRL